MKLYDGYIELSDEHLIWKLNNCNLNEQDANTLYDMLIYECINEFRTIYGMEFYMWGRNGRHICVDNTPENRRKCYNMKRTIDRLQKWFVNEFNSAKCLVE